MPASAAACDHRRAHRVGIGVRRAARPVVDVVELADQRDAGQRHLGERRARQRQVVCRGPGPRPSAYICSRQVQNEPVAGLGAAAQRALERVRVRVGQARQREAGPQLGAVGRGGRGRR